MPHQSEAQKKTVERVMHEFKHGELRTGSDGAEVENPKQAIAIALSEAGASNREKPAANRRHLRSTKAKERKGETARDRAEGGRDRSKADLYAEARRRGIEGRSKMSKTELARAVAQ